MNDEELTTNVSEDFKIGLKLGKEEAQKETEEKIVKLIEEIEIEIKQAKKHNTIRGVKT